MRTISAFSFVCVIVRTMSREKKQCQIQETPKKKKKKNVGYKKPKKKKTKKRWNIEKDTLEPVHTAWLQNVTHPRPEKTCAHARACTLPVSP